MAIELPDARQLSDEALQVLRLRALHGIEQGYSEVELALLLGVSHETVCRWWTAYQADGVTALPGDRTGRPLGSGRLLSDEQAQRLQTQIDNHTPEQLDLPHALWTRRAVRDLIRKEFNLDVAERTVGKYLREWGYTSKKPARHARRQDPDEVLQWLEETYPAIESFKQRKNMRKSFGPMKSASMPTIIPVMAMPAAASRRGWRCPDRTCVSTKSRRSAMMARCSS